MIPFKDNQPSYNFPIMTWLLVIANVAVFFYEIYMASFGLIGSVIYTGGLIPAEVFGAPTLETAADFFTHMFLHAGFSHLIGNMLFLIVFGRNVEDTVGSLGFPFFYIMCGLAASITQIIFTPTSPLPLIGASGAIAGVLGGYITLHPDAKISTWIFPIFVVKPPALLVLGYWFVLQLFYSYTSLGVASLSTSGGVAYFAHAGGFVAGIVLMLIAGILSE